MKSKYCFIQPQGLNSPEAFIYVVWVGSSLRELAVKSLVEEYAKDTVCYFRKWTCLVDSHIEKADARFRGNAGALGFCFRSISVSIGELSNLIVDDAFGAIEKDYVMSHSEKWARFHNSIAYIQEQNKSLVSQHASPSLRKYLSLGMKSQRVKAVACFIGILMMIALDAIVSHIENSFFSGCF